MRIALALLAGAAILSCSGPAVARVQLTPTADVRQILTYNDINDDTVTYTEASVGLNGTIDTRRVKASINYNYGRRFVQTGDNLRENRHSLFSRADVTLIDNRLSVQAGGFAALLNRDLRGQVSFTPDQANPNLVQTYSVYVEPRYQQPIGDAADFDLSYRVGYTNVADGNSGGRAPGSIPGSALVDVATDRVSDSVNQMITARLGNQRQNSRVRFDLTGTATLEDMTRLDQSYRAYDARFEVEYVVQRGIGLIANAGYERYRNSQAEVLRDIDGTPIPGPDGDFQVDPTGLRRSLYSQQGLSYEGGIRLQPTRKTFVLVKAGRRFGNFAVNGQAQYQYSPRLAFSAQIVERIDSFGRLLTRDLDGIRVQTVINTAQTVGLTGCVYGVDPGGGGCLFNATQSITNATFRNRSAQFTAEAKHGRTNATMSVIYGRRTFLDTQALQTPGTPLIDASITGRSDETITLDGRISRAVSHGDTISFGLFGSRYRFALSDNRRDYYLGSTGQYTALFGRRLVGSLSATAARRFSDAAQRSTEFTASAGFGYRF